MRFAFALAFTTAFALAFPLLAGGVAGGKITQGSMGGFGGAAEGAASSGNPGGGGGGGKAGGGGRVGGKGTKGKKVGNGAGLTPPPAPTDLWLMESDSLNSVSGRDPLSLNVGGFTADASPVGSGSWQPSSTGQGTAGALYRADGPQSWAAWAKFAGGSNETLWSYGSQEGTDGDGRDHWRIQRLSTGAVRFLVWRTLGAYYDGTEVMLDSSAGAIPVDEWVHLAWTLDTSGTTMAIYVNGESVASTTTAPPTHVSTTPEILIAGRAFYAWAGWADACAAGTRTAHLAWWDGTTLTPTQVADAYNWGEAGRSLLEVLP